MRIVVNCQRNFVSGDIVLSMRLKRFMEAKNLNKNSLSKKIKVSASTVGEIESGEITEPRAKFFLALNREFPDLNLHWLLTGQGDMFLKEALISPTPATNDKISDTHDEKYGIILANLAKMGEKIDTLHSALNKAKAPIPVKNNIIPFPERPWPVYVEDLPKGAGKVHITSLDEIDIIGRITVNSPERLDFASRVRGGSMEPEIPDNALIFIQKTPPGIIKDGDIAVCYDAEAFELMVRRVWFHERGSLLEVGMESNNPKKVTWKICEDREDDSRSCPLKILGKVVKWEKDEKMIKEMLAGMEDVNS